MAETHRSRHQVFGLSGRIDQKRPHSSSAGPAPSTGQFGWTKETSTGTIEGAHRASTRISNLCACTPSTSANLRPVRPSRIAARTPRTPTPHMPHVAHAAPRAPGARHHTHPACCSRFARGGVLEARPYGVNQRCPCAPAPPRSRALTPRTPSPTRPARPAFDTPRVPRQAPHLPR